MTMKCIYCNSSNVTDNYCNNCNTVLAHNLTAKPTEQPGEYQKEYYLNTPHTDFCIWNNKTYYFETDTNFPLHVMEASTNGNNIKTLVQSVDDKATSEFRTYLHVNDCGIFVYRLAYFYPNSVSVKLFDFSGNLIKNIILETDAGRWIDNIAFSNNRIYFSTSEIQLRDPEDYPANYPLSSLTCDFNSSIDKASMEEAESVSYTSQLYYSDITAENNKRQQIFKLPDCTINNILAHKQTVYIQAKFKEIKDEEPQYKDGWYKFDTKYSKLEFLREESWLENQILCFNFDTQTMWVKGPKKPEWSDEFNYIYPLKIKSGTPVINTNLPIWKISNNLPSSYPDQIYISSKYCYIASTYYEMYTLQPDGTTNELTEDNQGHGVCDKFLVMNNFLYVDTDAMDGYRRQYPLSQMATEPIRKLWFNPEVMLKKSL